MGVASITAFAASISMRDRAISEVIEINRFPGFHGAYFLVFLLYNFLVFDI